MNYIIAIKTLFQSNSLKLSERSQILDGKFDFNYLILKNH